MGRYVKRNHSQAKALLSCCLLVIVVVFSSCTKDENPGPFINFKHGGGYISGDTALKPGQAVLFGIHAENLIADITNLQIKRVYDGGEEVLIDTGIHNATFDYSRILYKGVYDTETWIFRVTDQEGMRAEISFVLSNDPMAVYDSILYIPSVTLGAQLCVSRGSFYDPDDDSVYFLDQAYLVQDSIHLCYYYDAAGDENTISSPGANIDSLIFPGASGLYNWTVRNESRFFETAISSASFDAVVSDSLMIAAYDELNSKRKAKNLLSGEVYSFKTVEGKFGLFKVISVVGTTQGTIEVAIKMQK